MSLITRLAGRTFTDATLPILYPDTLLNVGSKLLFDFKNPVCYGSQGASAPNGTVFNNLVPSAPSGALTGGALAYAGGGLLFTGIANNYVDLGTSYALDALSPAPAILAIVWAKRPTGGTGITGAFQGLAGLATSTSAFQWLLNYTLATPVYQGGAASRNAGGANIANDAVFQLAVSYTPATSSTGSSTAYINGVAVSSSTVAASAFPAVAGSARIGSAGSHSTFGGYIYRHYLENLTISGKTALAQVQADYAANSARFT